jgi:hypothetical protein
MLSSLLKGGYIWIGRVGRVGKKRKNFPTYAMSQIATRTTFITAKTTPQKPECRHDENGTSGNAEPQNQNREIRPGSRRHDNDQMPGDGQRSRNRMLGMSGILAMLERRKEREKGRNVAFRRKRRTTGRMKQEQRRRRRKTKGAERMKTEKTKTEKWWTEKFPNKKSLIAAIREAVNRQTAESPIVGEDEKFLMWVLSHHFEFFEKTENFQYLKIRINHERGFAPTRGIWVARNGMPDIDISWVVAVTCKPSEESDKKLAARNEIAYQISEFRKQNTQSVCELCGEEMTDADAKHVDHTAPFDLLFYWFFKDITNAESRDTGIRREFVDRRLAERWQKYHRENARLRMVHATCNLKRGRKYGEGDIPGIAVAAESAVTP